MNFEPAIEAQLDGRVVMAAALVELGLDPNPIRLWNGNGLLVTQVGAPDEREWEGLGGLGTIEEIGQATNGASPTQSIALSGIDPRISSLATGPSADYYGAIVRIYLQWFDEDWQVLGDPVAISVRLLDRLRAARHARDDGQIVRTVTAKTESPLSLRRRPPFAYFTDRDQKRRHSGDRGFEHVSTVERTITFPDW